MEVRVLVDGEPGDRIAALDRGLAYGDGLFETIRFVEGAAPLWSRHMRRLVASCSRLSILPPATDALLAEAKRVTDGLHDAVVRITVTRGVGQRGYAFASDARPTRIVAAFDAPAVVPDRYRSGVRLHVCDLRLSEQPRLAGIKHLNRLEQVLARAEWQDPLLDDGVLRDASDRVISTVMANLFAVIDGELVTPILSRCGVEGVARAEVLAWRPGVCVRDIAFDELAQASEIFLSSSVRGILPVQAVGNTVYVPGPVGRMCQQHWRGLGFPMEHA